MKTSELRQLYLNFFAEKQHAVIPSASLIPENDPTTLFTSAGMQPMIPYLMGEKHPAGTRLVDSQKCFRTQDIDSVGDNRHTTCFEMLGNWSLGDYFKIEQINWMFDFLINKTKLDPNRFYVTCFRGMEEIGIPRDTEAAEKWQAKFKEVNVEAKIVDNAETEGMQGGRIFYYNEKENWWSRAGVTSKMPVGEPGGPDSEMFWDFDPKGELQIHEKSDWKDAPCHPACDCGRFVEIGNNVFMQYVKTKNGFEPLKNKNIDFGGGLERMVAAMNDDSDIFNIDAFAKAKEKLEKLSGKKYGENKDEIQAFRVILDHLRAATFLIADGAVPSNKDQGYFTRRLIRRSIRYANKLGISNKFCADLADTYIEVYKDVYTYFSTSRDKIVEELNAEEDKFSATLENGLKVLKANVASWEKNFKNIKFNGGFSFLLYESYGFPPEMTLEELLKYPEVAKQLDVEEYWAEFRNNLKQHQDLSRAGAEQKFKGGLADTSETTARLHTATHLLQAALRKVLGIHVEQRGSNITAERLRFDFTHGEKMTDEQKKQVEDLVNEWIQKDFEVKCEELPYAEAKTKNVMGLFENKYGDLVKVYTIGDVSGEICGGPHANRTGELGKFKISKEEASSSGVRRIKAVLE
ncbi:MAG: alanyl-tRNA synthetase [Parcubacteria group bacterium GW2011_GWA2_40_23]|nr:MAG: alanyl-tRNA synthetase [Parcubacteria group bacterium GW2011_GWA2_40_23]